MDVLGQQHDEVALNTLKTQEKPLLAAVPDAPVAKPSSLLQRYIDTGDSMFKDAAGQALSKLQGIGNKALDLISSHTVVTNNSPTPNILSNPEKPPENKSTPVYAPIAPHLKNAVELAQQQYPEVKGLLPAVISRESSMASDTSNALNDAGHYGWIAGITKSTWNDLMKRQGQPNVPKLSATMLSTPAGAVQAAAAILAYHSKIYNDAGEVIGTRDPTDTYIKKYNGGGTIFTPTMAEDMANRISYYSKQ